MLDLERSGVVGSMLEDDDVSFSAELFHCRNCSRTVTTIFWMSGAYPVVVVFVQLSLFGLLLFQRRFGLGRQGDGFLEL